MKERDTLHHYIKRSFIIFAALFSILLCLFISNIPYVQHLPTVYAEEENEICKGDSGENVKWVQHALNVLDSADLVEDGDFGDATEAALKNFQSHHGISQTGTANSVTIEMLKTLLRQEEGKQTTETAEEPTAEAAGDVDTPDPDDPRHIPPKDKDHLLRGYWQEYFITLKSIVTDFKATVSPVFLKGIIWLVICFFLFIVFAVFNYTPERNVTVIDRFHNILEFRHYDASIGDTGCLFRVLGTITLISIAVSPFRADIMYIRKYSDAGWGKTISTAILLLLIKVAVGFIAGGLILLLVFVILEKISDELGALVGLISGAAVFLLIYLTPSIMGAWLDINKAINIIDSSSSVLWLIPQFR